MNHTYHIHIKGLVQGVGFRPFVCRLAGEMNINGWVSNTNDGVHIEITSNKRRATTFYHQLVSQSPVNAVITGRHFTQIASKSFNGFTIQQSTATEEPDLLLTPDIAICEECKQEINDPRNKRFGYAFTTCLNCGPRYSITKSLPYDRENTTMADLQMCDGCAEEYNDIKNRRHYSQTNSCNHCSIKMHLYSSKEEKYDVGENEIVDVIANVFEKGKILAVKGMGGFLLMCDATNANAISVLRKRKHRPAKPFALLYANIEMAEQDVRIRVCEKEALQSKSAPIVLCKAKQYSGNGIHKALIAPGLDKIGVMLPCTPLLSLIADKACRPLIATSGNISGSPILYKDEDALENLFEVADLILTYDREIVAPQDDSVLQFSESGKKIILRRSRGLAPNYFPNPFREMQETVLATGGELKSAFALLNKKNLYISQFLGDQGVLESKDMYAQTLQNFTALLKATPEKILVDKHPGYAVSQSGKEIAIQKKLNSVIEVQHHKAHFGAVLAENDLLHTKLPVLGFIWDGNGFGDDHQIWGSEIFTYHHSIMERIGHLQYFPQLVGDKMSKEPRLSALSLLNNFPSRQYILKKHFSETEWVYYQKLLQQPQSVYTSSMGRFLDGIACISGISIFNAYEGEATMKMESLARNVKEKSFDVYPLPLVNGVLHWHVFLQQLLEDSRQQKDVSKLSYKVFYSLAMAIANISRQHGINQVAFSGGVFQNALLTDMVIEELSQQKQLYFHQQLSPNDECIGFGQLACFAINEYEAQQRARKKVLSTA